MKREREGLKAGPTPKVFNFTRREKRFILTSISVHYSPPVTQCASLISRQDAGVAASISSDAALNYLGERRSTAVQGHGSPSHFHIQLRDGEISLLCNRRKFTPVFFCCSVRSRLSKGFVEWVRVAFIHTRR